MAYLKLNRTLLLIAGLMVVVVVAAQQTLPLAAQAPATSSVAHAVAVPAFLPTAMPVAARAPATSPGAKAPYPGTYIFLDNGDVDPSKANFGGGQMKFFWSDIELAKDYFDWSTIDDWLEQQSSLGKPAVMGISLYDGRCCGGQHTPRWLQWQNPDTVVRCDAVGSPIPRYWHPQVLAEYREFIQTLAGRYDGDPRVAWIEMGTGIFGEAKPADSWDWSCLLNAGLTAPVWIETSIHMLDYYAEAFKETPVLYQFAPVYTPQGESMRQRRELTDYAAELGIGVKHNGLEPDTTTAIVDDPGKSYYKAGQRDPFFTHWQTVPTSWESYASQKCLDPVTGADSSGDHPTPQYDTSMLSGPAEQYGWGSAYITPLVQRWVDNPSANNGVLLLPFGNPVQWDLASSENPETRWRPAREILYYGPGNPAPTATPTPTATSTPTITPAPSLTPTPTITSSPAPTSTSTLTSTPTTSPTATPSPATGAIEGAAFHDLNQNQAHEQEEPGIAGVRIDLLRPGGDAIAAFTATDGSFGFPDLPSGNYVLSEEQPEECGPPKPGSPLVVLVIANHAHQLAFAHQPLPTATVTPTVPAELRLWLPRYLR